MHGPALVVYQAGEDGARTLRCGTGRCRSDRVDAPTINGDWSAKRFDDITGADRQVSSIERQTAIQQVPKGMRGWLVARRDPRQITGHHAVHRERIETVSTANIAADAPDEVGRYGVQVDGGVAVRLRRRTTTAATDVVVAQNECVRLQQPDTEAARVQDVVIGDPYRQSTERLAKDSFGARGRDPVAAEAQGCCRPRRSVVDVDPVNATADRRGRNRD